jgi:hypothetical protein
LDSLAVGYLAAAFVGKVASHLDASPRVVKTLVIGAGTLAAAFANTLAETKWGASWAFENSTPDHIDLAYGMAAGVLGASMVSVESVPVTE